MKLTFSPYIAFQVENYTEAVRFYAEIMGMDLVHAGEGEAELRSGPITFYVEPGDQRAVFFEFKTDDLAVAQEILRNAGCRIEPATTPEGNPSCFVYDPYGLIFHFWESDSVD